MNNLPERQGVRLNWVPDRSWHEPGNRWRAYTPDGQYVGRVVLIDEAWQTDGGGWGSIKAAALSLEAQWRAGLL